MGCGSSTPVKEPQVASTQTKPRPSGAGDGPRTKAIDVGLTDSFEYIKPLGQGGTGQTLLYKEKATGEQVAIKLIKRPIPKVIMPNILREITIQAELGEGHVNIIEAKEVLLTETHLALVMEFAAGNSLTGYVADKWQHAQHTGLFLGEDEARYFFRQFVNAVAYCHAQNVAHRDLKLDNTLLDSNRPQRIKLCDFGFAKAWEAGSKNMFTHIGTPVYMSPEQLSQDNGNQGYLGSAVDVWASGVLLIVMLVGAFPFDHIDNPDPNSPAAHEEVYKQQTGEKWSEVPHIAKAVEKLTPECMDLLNRILTPKEEDRITIPEIERHPWYNKPLTPHFAAAERQILAEQLRVDEVQKSRHISLVRIAPLQVNQDEAAKAAREAQLKDIVEQASIRPPSVSATATSPHMRIDLRQSAVIGNANGDTLGGLAEGDEEG